MKKLAAVQINKIDPGKGVSSSLDAEINWFDRLPNRQPVKNSGEVKIVKNVFIVMLNEPGHLIPSYTLANKLKNTGLYNVIYIANKEYEDEIRKRKFIFEEELSPRSIFPEDRYDHLNIFGVALRRFVDFFTDLRLQNKCFVRYLDKLVKEYKPVLILTDEFSVHYRIALYKHNIAMASLGIVLFPLKDVDIPPPNSRLIPDRSLKFRIQHQIEWYKILFSRWVEQIIKKAFIPRDDYYLQNLRQYAKYPREYITYRHGYWMSETNIDKIIMCPDCFDFPRPEQKNVYHIESCVDLSRNEYPFDWDCIKNDNPIVYLSLGTQARHHFKDGSQFLGRIISVFKELNNHNLIISLCGLASKTGLGELPENVYVFDEVPQVRVLERSRFMITHGGLGSIKECIALAVPMLVFPVNQSSDQEGNAARIVYHNIGMRGNIRKDNAEKMDRLIKAMINNSMFHANIRKMQTRFIEVERRNPFMNYVKLKVPGHAQWKQARSQAMLKREEVDCL